MSAKLNEGTELSSKCAAFELTASVPEGKREVHGRVRFLDASPATSVKVSLSLFGQLGEKAMGPGRLDAETPIAGCSTSVERSASEPDYALPLPPVAAGYVGTTFRIGVGVVATADDGSTLRVLLDVPAAGDDVRLLLRRLPIEVPLGRPARVGTGLAIALIGGALLVLAAQTAGAFAYAAGFIAVALGVALAGIYSRGMLGVLAVGPARIGLASGADNGQLVVAVRGGARVAGGRARLIAVEYELFEGARFEHREIASREAPLARSSDGHWSVELPLPAPREAPPSLALKAPSRVLSIRWFLRLELENPRGGRARASIPVHVGIESRP